MAKPNDALPAKTPILAANWKMNKGPADARHFFEEFCAWYAPRADRSVWFFPAAVAIEASVAALAERPDLVIGVQNIYWEPAGAFTGEISAPMARQAGARAALVGHSERRHIFGETDEHVARKVTAALSAGLSALVCVGETLEERESGRLETVLARQLGAVLTAVSAPDLPRLALAYEPVWAIGTGVNATPEDAAAAHRFLREQVAEAAGEDIAAALPILYGGSVKPDNAAELLAAGDVNGLLVGGASLKADHFARIAQAGA